MIAIPWHFASILGMPSFFGMLYAAITFSALFWGLFVGTAVDRYNRKSIFIAISISGGLILASIAASGYYQGAVHYWLAGLAFAVTYFIYSIHYPNLYAFAQEITEQKDYGRITSYIEIQGQLTSMLAGAFAAMLLTGVSEGSMEFLGRSIEFPFSIEKWELHEIFMLDALTYFVAFILILCIRYKSVADRVIDEGTVKERILTGFKFLKSNPYVFLYGTASFSVFVTILIIGFFLLPIYINNHLQAGAGTYAISDVCFAFGAVLAGVGIRWIFQRTTTVMAVILMSLSTAVIYFFYAYNYNIMLFYITMLMVGVSNAGIRILRMTYIFNHVPNDVIGRTNSVFGMINILIRLVFISAFAIPFFSEGNNIIYPFMILGIFILLSVVPMVYKYKGLIKS